ncbi:MAG: OmpA family protein [Candidatus Zixiibacteriota bacterium]
MKKTIIHASLALALVWVGPAHAQGTAAFMELKQLMDSIQTVEANLFAPKAYEKAKRRFDDAQLYVQQGRTPKDIDGYAVEGREFAQNALKAAEVAKLTLKEYLPPRDKAKTARAQALVPDLYGNAELQFLEATKRVESGDVKGALKEAEKSSPMFDTAELEAVRKDILGRGDSLIAVAIVDEAPKYALATLDKAKSAREKSSDLVTKNRYDREPAIKEATRAEYEALHASNIAQSVRSLNRNDQAWEKLMLLYEIQLDRIGNAVGIDNLPYYRGTMAVADSIIARLKSQQSATASAEKTRQDTIATLNNTVAALQADQAALSNQLASTLKRLNIEPTGSDPTQFAHLLDSGISTLQTQQGELAQKIESEQSKLTELSAAHQEVSSALQAKQEQEAKLDSAKAILNPTEGEMLINATNDVVLRLFGISFAAGKSEITDLHRPLLDKVQKILALFPTAHFVVEGHTDDKGDPQGNTQLSEKRAYSVMQYLRQTMTLAADRIRAIGYGSEKPIASQATPEGRAKNRRIDIIITP